MDAGSERARMAKESAPLSAVQMAHGDLRTHLLHYETLRDYYKEILDITCNIGTTLAVISQARTGLPRLENRLAELRGQVNGAQLGEVIEPIWIATLKEMTALMEDILERRRKIYHATADLAMQRSALVKSQKLIADWYTEKLPDAPAT